MIFCDCDWPEETLITGKYFCTSCTKVIPCEVCEECNEGPSKQATIKHIDYYVCKDHEWVAISKVADRIY